MKQILIAVHLDNGRLSTNADHLLESYRIVEGGVLELRYVHENGLVELVHYAPGRWLSASHIQQHD